MTPYHDPSQHLGKEQRRMIKTPRRKRWWEVEVGIQHHLRREAWMLLGSKWRVSWNKTPHILLQSLRALSGTSRTLTWTLLLLPFVFPALLAGCYFHSGEHFSVLWFLAESSRTCVCSSVLYGFFCMFYKMFLSGFVSDLFDIGNMLYHYLCMWLCFIPLLLLFVWPHLSLFWLARRKEWEVYPKMHLFDIPHQPLLSGHLSLPNTALEIKQKECSTLDSFLFHSSAIPDYCTGWTIYKDV